MQHRQILRYDVAFGEPSLQLGEMIGDRLATVACDDDCLQGAAPYNAGGLSLPCLDYRQLTRAEILQCLSVGADVAIADDKVGGSAADGDLRAKALAA
jgi:hypothetical protein